MSWIGTPLYTDEISTQQNDIKNMRSTPSNLPGGRPESSSTYGDMFFNSPMNQAKKSKMQTAQNDSKLQKGSDASYGISGYVNTKEEYKQALQEKNHPYVYDSPSKSPMNQGTKSKYKAVNVQDLEDMGRVKKDKISQYVVNSDEMKTGTSRDTLRLPPNAKHYSGKKYKTGQMIDETDFEDFTKKINKK